MLKWSQTKKIPLEAQFLQQNLAKCSKHVNSLSYTTFVHPILDYACTVWSPYYQSYIHSIEMEQWRVAKFVMNK